MVTLIFGQLNTHHCKAAMAHLALCVSVNHIDILLIQEPYCHNGEPTLIPPNFITYFIPSNNNPRACILIRRNIAHKFVLLHNFSTPDNVIVVTTASSPNYIVSSYLPPYDTLEQDLTPMDSFLNAIKPAKMIWGLDANSKHGMWFSPTTDARGRNLVEFLSLNGLLTVNEKDGPTYSGPTGDSWIDITVTTINSAHSIQNWKVSEDVRL